MSELKNCPFCGGEPNLELFNDGFFDYARIRCCNLIFDWCDDKTGEKVVTAWNRRAEGWISVSERLPEKGECLVAHADGTVCSAMVLFGEDL